VAQQNPGTEPKSSKFLLVIMAALILIFLAWAIMGGKQGATPRGAPPPTTNNGPGR
jgi:hypothetical protein